MDEYLQSRSSHLLHIPAVCCSDGCGSALQCVVRLPVSDQHVSITIMMMEAWVAEFNGYGQRVFFSTFKIFISSTT